jgi:hypothetical protein
MNYEAVISHACRVLDQYSIHIWWSASSRATRAAPAEANEGAEHVGVPMCVAGPVLDAGEDDIELKGEDGLEDMHVHMAGSAMLASAPHRFVASARPGWRLERRKCTREERRRYQSRLFC